MPPALSGRGSSGDDTWGRVEAKAGLSSLCAAGTTVRGRMPGVLDHSDCYSWAWPQAILGTSSPCLRGK